MLCFFFVSDNKASEGEGELQNASLLAGGVQQCFIHTPLARFPFLLSQVSIFGVKPIENHKVWDQQGSPERGQKGLSIDRGRARAHFSNLDRQASSGRPFLAMWIDRHRANGNF